MTNALQELKFYEEHLTKPHCYDTLMKAKREGVLTDKSRGRRVRELAEIIKHSDNLPVWFNAEKNRWEVLPDIYSIYGYDFSMERAGLNWKNSMRFGDRTLTRNIMLSSSDGRESTVSKVQVNLMYGLEIELLVNTELNTNYAFGGLRREVVGLFGGTNNACTKRDGSLDGFEPFELVTVPMVYSDMHKYLKNFANSGTKEKLSVNETCGIHYHVSRAPFTELQTEALLFFCHVKHNENFIRAVSGRQGDTRYCVYKGQLLEDNGITRPEHMGRLVNNEPAICLFTDHFDVVSVSQRHPTFEFRMFASTLDKTKLIASFEFVAAICEYIKSGSIVNRWKYEDFLEWFSDPYNTRYKQADRKAKGVVGKHPQYPHLHEVLVGLGYL